jgi:hypothetical protein
MRMGSTEKRVLERAEEQDSVRSKDLDLSDREEFGDRISSSDIRRVLMVLQIEQCVFPATDPGVLRKRFRESSKGSRLYSLEDYFGEAADFYRERGEDKVVERLESQVSEGSSDGVNIEKVKEVVKSRVSED